MIPEIILSTIVSLTPTEKSTVHDLQTRLKKDGYNISQYLKDPRFEIYKFKDGGKARNYADTTQSWYMKTDSIKKCADFVEEYYYYLKKAEEKYGPSPEELVSQLELETNRGQFTGEYPVLNSLVSMYLNRESRRNEFYIYLTDFLKLAKDNKGNVILPEDIFDIKGSWAGAYGIAQGMPSLIKNNGEKIDSDGDGKFNPMSVPDAIEFLAYELFQCGYKKNPAAAIQRYNPGDRYYASSIRKHTAELAKIVERRRRMPLEKISCKLNPAILDIKPQRDNALKLKNIPLIFSEAHYKTPFIKRIAQNFRLGRRNL